MPAHAEVRTLLDVMSGSGVRNRSESSFAQPRAWTAPLHEAEVVRAVKAATELRGARA